MSAKEKKQTMQKEPHRRKEVHLQVAKDDTEEEMARKFSRLATSSELAAFRGISAAEGKASIGERIDVPTLLEQLRDQAAAVNRGDLSQAEAMLMNQSTSLQSLFCRLTEKAMSAELLAHFDSFMRMALRAQNQCRATLETLAAIKNPPIVYARQANVTTGPQQINNGAALPARTRENEIEQTQLSGGGHELLPDTRTTGDACRVNSALETLGEIDGAKIGRG